MLYSSHCVLPGGGTLLAVVETRRERRGWFRTVERSETVGYVLRGGFWWGERNERVTDPHKILKLSELVLQQGVREAVDQAAG